MNRIAYLAFTDQGAALAERLCRALGGETSRGGDDVPLGDWTRAHFPLCDALVYIGAAGIAVRAVGPYLSGKGRDPAVVAVDELGRFAVPLASGHLGGANDLARAIAALTGGTAVVTTATDLHGLFAVDAWARCQDCAITPVSGIKAVSGALLAGKSVTLRSAFPIGGEVPPGVVLTGGAADITVDIRPGAGLRVIPRALVLGIGCRRGITAETLEGRFRAFCGKNGLCPEAFCAAATISRKADEPGLRQFCRERRLPLAVFPAEALRGVPGKFTASAFVESRVGVDNVCERGAVLCAAGALIAKKEAGEGVALAAARRPLSLTWRWRNG